MPQKCGPSEVLDVDHPTRLPTRSRHMQPNPTSPLEIGKMFDELISYNTGFFLHIYLFLFL